MATTILIVGCAAKSDESKTTAAPVASAQVGAAARLAAGFDSKNPLLGSWSRLPTVHDPAKVPDYTKNGIDPATAAAMRAAALTGETYSGDGFEDVTFKADGTLVARQKRPSGIVDAKGTYKVIPGDGLKGVMTMTIPFVGIPVPLRYVERYAADDQTGTLTLSDNRLYANAGSTFARK